MWLRDREPVQPTRHSGLEKVKSNSNHKMPEKSRPRSGADTLEGALGWNRNAPGWPCSIRGIEEALDWGASLSGSLLMPCVSVFSSQLTQSLLWPRIFECVPAGNDFV